MGWLHVSETHSTLRVYTGNTLPNEHASIDITVKVNTGTDTHTYTRKAFGVM
jgi:hypothetical protein